MVGSMGVTEATRGALRHGEGAPFWSVMIPTYLPNAHLRETLESARAALMSSELAAQLEIVDDASPDLDVEALVRSWGFTEVVVHRRARNGGLGACWNTCIERARGQWIHILHQDDLVKPLFYRRMSEMAARHPSAGMVFCRTEFLEGGQTRLDQLEQAEGGLLPDWLGRISSGQRLQCPSVVIRRETYERVGRFDDALRYVIDWEMWIRVAAACPVAYVAEALAIYRIHPAAQTRKIKAAGITTKDLAAGLRRIHKTLRAAGRPDCIPGASAYALQASGFAAYEAEQAQQPGLAAKEISSSLRYLMFAMDFRRLLQQLWWYLRLRVKSIA
jgi:GT2 family glycosyltransferase